MEYADSTLDLSVFHNINEEFTFIDFGDQENFVSDQRGFKSILQDLEADVRLGVSVKMIEYGEDHVIINGQYQAEYVILTVSIGVL